MTARTPLLLTLLPWLLLSACDDGGSVTPIPDAEPDMAEVVDMKPTSECTLDSECGDDQWCSIDDAFIGTCRAGCRTGPDTCDRAAREVCDLETRRCRVLPCERGEHCASDQFCDDGTCRAGCRSAPDNCRPVDGVTYVCVTDSRTCAPLYACCDAEQRCSLKRPTQCEGQLFVGLAACMPDPCTAPCDTDVDCPAESWCDGDRGRCNIGCRVGPRTACAADTACDPASRLCIPAVCEDDAACPAWQFCRGGACFDGCRTGACAEGEYCDPVGRLCRESCDPQTHAGCQIGERCDGETARCVVGCADDIGDLGAGDDEPARATALATVLSGAVRRAASGDRVACPADPDVYAFDVRDGERLQVTLQHDPGRGRLQLAIDGPSGAVGRWTPLDPTLVVRVPQAPGEPAAAGRYLVTVTPLEGADGIDYTLDLAANDAARGCFGDAADPADDQPAGATRAGLAGQPRFTDSFERDLCPGETDLICFEMSLTDGLEAVVVAPPGCALTPVLVPEALAEREAGASARALEPGEPTPAGRAWRLYGEPNRRTFTAESWCLRVRGETPDVVCEGYTVDLTFLRQGDDCRDAVEPNDGIATATPLDGDGPLADLEGRVTQGVDHLLALNTRICEGDRDVFTLQANAGDALRAWLVADPQADDLRGELTVQFLDGAGAPRGDTGGVNADAAGDDRALAVAAGDDRFYLQVSGQGASTGTYRLYVRRDTGGGLCGGDLYETAEVRSDVPEQAQDLREIEGPERRRVSNAAICHPGAEITDEDWYALDVARDATRICVNAAFRQRDGNLDVDLFWAGEERAVRCEEGCQAADTCVLGLCRQPRTVGTSRTDNEILTLAAAQVVAGPYLVRVRGDGRAENGYDLSATLVPPFDGVCPPDYRERTRSNDEPGAATPLGSGRVGICDAWLCEGERNTGDWYVIDVPANADRTVHLGYSPRDDGVLLLTAEDAADPLRAVESLQLQTSAQCLNIQGGAVDRQVRIHVSADTIVDDGDGRVDYALQVVPTDMDRFARGACDRLNGNLFFNIGWPLLRLDDEQAAP